MKKEERYSGERFDKLKELKDKAVLTRAEKDIKKIIDYSKNKQLLEEDTLLRRRGRTVSR